MLILTRLHATLLLKTVVVFLFLAAPSPSVARTEVRFSPKGGCEEMVVNLIDTSKTSIDAAVYSLNNPRLAKALIRAKQRGLAIHLLLDRTQAAGRSNKLILAEIIAAGIDVRLHSRHRIEHNKFGVYDHARVSTGSFNWTAPAEEKNSENCLSLDDPETVATYATQFKSVLWPQNTVAKSLASIRKLLPQLRAPASADKSR